MQASLEDEYGQRKTNDYINEIRAKVDAWRTLGRHPLHRHPRAEVDRLRTLNAEANPDLLRIAFKLTIGASKTTVMAMLIAWQALNAARARNSPPLR